MKPDEKIASLDAALAGLFGRPRNRPSGRPVEGLVRTILSQNTSDVNSARAYRSLIDRFGDLDAVRRAPVRSIEAAIRSGGLARVKSVRLRHILSAIHRRHGRLSLSHLKKLPPADALAALTAFSGVGPKTAHCVLLFDLGVPVFPVDTHILRIARRLGLVPEGAGLEAAHRLLASLVPGHIAYPLHVNLIRYGREVCRPRPRCGRCVVFGLCEWEGRRAAATARSSTSSRGSR